MAELVIGDEIRAALRDVIDSEVGIDIVDLGLIKDIIVEDDYVEVDMVLTTYACPLVRPSYRSGQAFMSRGSTGSIALR